MPFHKLAILLGIVIAAAGVTVLLATKLDELTSGSIGLAVIIPFAVGLSLWIRSRNDHNG